MHARGAEALGTYYEAMRESTQRAGSSKRQGGLNPEGMRPFLKHAGFLARRGEHEESDELFDLAFSRYPDEPRSGGPLRRRGSSRNGNPAIRKRASWLNDILRRRSESLARI